MNAHGTAYYLEISRWRCLFQDADKVLTVFDLVIMAHVASYESLHCGDAADVRGSLCRNRKFHESKQKNCIEWKFDENQPNARHPRATHAPTHRHKPLTCTQNAAEPGPSTQASYIGKVHPHA